MEKAKKQQAQEVRKPYAPACLQVFHYDDDVICSSGCTDDCKTDVICPINTCTTDD